jgi:hypothetical protein
VRFIFFSVSLEKKKRDKKTFSFGSLLANTILQYGTGHTQNKKHEKEMFGALYQTRARLSSL